MLKKADFKMIFLTSLGGMLEFYDFIIFATFAIVLGQTFFPKGESMALAALYSFTVFAVGYLARPFGGVIFGHIGDKFGRKNSFILTILLMGLSSFLIAVLPSYQSIGITATLLFVLLRIIQGASLGGEIPGAVVFLRETLLKNGGLACGMVFCFINFGIFFAEITKTITTSYFSDTYAWRVAFILGGVAAIMSYFLRKEMNETKVFLETEKSSNLPIVSVFKTQKVALIKAMACISITAVVVGFYSLFLPTFFELNNYNDASFLILLNLFIFSVSCIPAGILADKYTPLKIFLIGTIGLLIFGSIFYISIMTHSHYLVYAMCINAIFMGLIVGTAANYSSMLFDPNVRASGLGLSYNITFAIFNGVFLALASYGISTGIMLSPLYLALAVTLVSLVILVYTIIFKK